MWIFKITVSTFALSTGHPTTPTLISAAPLCFQGHDIKVSALESEVFGRQKRSSEKLLLKNLHVHCNFLVANAQTHSQFSLQFGSNSGFCAGTQKAAYEGSDV